MTIGLCALITFVEMICLNTQNDSLSFTLALLRSLFMLMQSTWLIQIGILFFIFGEDEKAVSSKQTNHIHGRLMNLASGFTLHIFFNLIFLLIVSAISQKRSEFLIKDTCLMQSPNNDNFEEEILLRN